MSVDRVLPATVTPVLHSQLCLPRRKSNVKDFPFTDNYESLWIRVNRICDRYISSPAEALPASSD